MIIMIGMVTSLPFLSQYSGFFHWKKIMVPKTFFNQVHTITALLFFRDKIIIMFMMFFVVFVSTYTL